MFFFIIIGYNDYGDSMFDINILNKSNDREGMISKFECVKVIFSRAANDPNLNRYFDDEDIEVQMEIKKQVELEVAIWNC